MKLLIVADPGAWENRRLEVEAGRAGHLARTARLEDLVFDVRGRKRDVRHGTKSVFASYDAVYLRWFYPYFSEALLLAEWARARGLRVLDRTLAEDNFVYSKLYDAWKLAEAGLPVPDGFQVMRLDHAEALLKKGAWPVVAKGVHGSQGRYVFKVKNLTQARRSLKKGVVGFFTFQENLKIDDEYRVIVIGGRAIGAVRKRATSNDFRRNLSAGATGEPAELSMALRKLCERAARVLKREFAGVDLAIAGGRPYILEVNRRPGFKGFEEITGINVARAFICYAAERDS